MELVVTFAGGRQATATIKAIDLVQVERRFKMSIPALGEDVPPSFEQTLFMAYASLKRQGDIDKAMPFDGFLETVDEIEDPTTAAKEDAEDAGEEVAPVPLAEPSDS